MLNLTAEELDRCAAKFGIYRHLIESDESLRRRIICYFSLLQKRYGDYYPNPCPFCNNDPVLVYYERELDLGIKKIECMPCEMMMYKVNFGESDHSLIERWNRRRETEKNN